MEEQGTPPGIDNLPYNDVTLSYVTRLGPKNFSAYVNKIDRQPGRYSRNIITLRARA